MIGQMSEWAKRLNERTMSVGMEEGIHEWVAE